MENKIWTLLARQLTGEATMEELRELQEILTKDPALTKMAQEIRETWYDQNTHEMQKALSSFAKIDAQIQNRATRPAMDTDTPVIQARSWFSRFRIAIAAAASVIVLLGLWFIYRPESKQLNSNQPIAALHEISTSSKSIREASLPDGSVIHLNEDSRITYNDEFNNRYREVWLTGEAFFDVAKNKEKPFIIHTGNVNIKVLGTAFNVRSYQDEQSVETSLIHGSVEITLSDDPSKKYLLVPNQKLVIPVKKDNTADSLVAIPAIKEIKYSSVGSVKDIYSADSVIAELSWMQGKLAFEETSFKDLSVRLEKRFNVSFVFENKSKEQLEFTGVFFHQNLEEILQRLSIAGSFNYRIKDNIVYIN